MKTSIQARGEAVAWLATSEFAEAKPTLIDSSTEEFSAGWVYYQSALFLRTNNFQHMLVGNAPIFIPRNGAQPEVISYHRPTSESAAAFLYCGTANAKPNAEIELRGWKEGACKASASQAIRAYSSLGLLAAHKAIHHCLVGQAIRIKTTNVVAARQLVSNLEELGFISCITYGA